MAFGPADRDGTNRNKDRIWKGPITGPSNRHNHYQRQNSCSGMRIHSGYAANC